MGKVYISKRIIFVSDYLNKDTILIKILLHKNTKSKMHKSDNASEQNPKSLEYDDFLEEDEGLKDEDKENEDFKEQ